METNLIGLTVTTGFKEEGIIRAITYNAKDEEGGFTLLLQIDTELREVPAGNISMVSLPNEVITQRS